jgi:CheY-like chemotaxis protein
MDVQMPEMGGIEATQLIRQMEQKGKKRIPIIALTAHASKEDRDRCIAAGMDQYLSKPVRATELYNAIENIFDNTQNVVVKPVIVETNYLPSEKIRPPQELLESVNGNKDLLIKIINTFSGYRKNALQEICLAIQQHDTLMLQRTAHSLKGVVAQFSDNRAFKLAERLEELGKAGVLEEAQNSYNQLELAVEEMTHELQQFKASLHS